MKKRDYFIIGMCVLIFFLSAFHLGFTAGKDVTTISFTGLPDDAVIHFEVDKGGAE